MHGLTSKAVNHLYAEWGKTTAVVGFGSEKADGRLDEGIKTFLGRKISLVAGIAAQNRVGQSMVLWRGIQPIVANWLPTSFLIRRSSSASSLHAMILQWQSAQRSGCKNVPH